MKGEEKGGGMGGWEDVQNIKTYPHSNGGLGGIGAGYARSGPGGGVTRDRCLDGDVQGTKGVLIEMGGNGNDYFNNF